MYIYVSSLLDSCPSMRRICLGSPLLLLPDPLNISFGHVLFEMAIRYLSRGVYDLGFRRWSGGKSAVGWSADT